MATAENERRSRRRSLLFIGPLVAVLIAIGVAGLSARPGDPAPGSTFGSLPWGPVPEFAPVTIEASSAQTYTSLATLRTASAIVLRGRVVGSQRGTLVGAPGPQGAAHGIVSRLVDIEVLEGFGNPAGYSLTGTVVTVEEEGWLLDGPPIAVNGVAPLGVGAEAVWFLVPLPAEANGGGADTTKYIQINSQGRFEIVSPTGSATPRLRGADPDDTLVRQVEASGVEGLLAGLRRP